ncbi:MFS transporter [Rhodococcus sp. NPDC057014]|uniref:MFS transporter n=1 Tax=Rhodococcus sp. NPDC057014 TaxID=3346000 RepID=UPI003642CC7D
MDSSTSDSQQQNALAKRTVTKVSLRILPFITVLYILNFLDRVNISYARLGMETEMALTAATFGLAAAIFFIGYFFFEVPSNMMLRIVGARKWIARIVFSWGIVIVATGFVNSIPMLYGARILLGIAEAGFFPGMLLYLTFWFRSQDRARAVAFFTLAQPIAYIVGAVTAGFILEYVDWFGLSSWRWIFILQGAPAIVMGVVTYFYLPDGPKNARWLTHQERSWLEGELTKEQGPPVDESPRAQLRALRNPRVLHLAAIYLTATAGLFGFNFFLPSIVKQLDPSYSATNIGFVAAIPYIVGAIAMLIIARHSDKTGERKYHVAAVLALSTVALGGAIAFRHDPMIAMICLSIFAIGGFGYIAPFWALVSKNIPAQHAAVGIAVVNSVGNLGGFIGPYLVGKSASPTNVGATLYVPIVSFALCIIILLCFRTPRTTNDPKSTNGTQAVADVPVRHP